MVKAIVLLSGGLDSATTLYAALDAGRLVQCISFDYGQPHRNELEAAQRIASIAGVELEVISLPVAFGRSKMAGGSGHDGVSPYYVPARNAVMCSAAVSVAEARGSQEIWVGFNADDAAGFPDCRAEWIAAFNAMTALGTTQKPRLVAPLLDFSKQRVAQYAAELNVPIALTLSCYNGSGCGECDACMLRTAALS